MVPHLFLELVKLQINFHKNFLVLFSDSKNL